MARALEAGGSERQMREVAKALDRSKFTPHVGCFRPEGDSRRELEGAGVSVVHFPIDSFASTQAASGAFAFVRYIRQHGIRLVHAFDYPAAVFSIPVTRALTRAAAVSSQRSHRDLIPGPYRKLVRLTDRLADAIVVNCEFVRRHLENDERVPAARIRLCYNGLDPDVFRPLDGPRPPALARDSLVIAAVCALRPEKGLSTLLQAFAQVRQTRSRITLLLVGDGPMREPLQAQAQALNITGDCVFVSATNDVAPWLQSSDVFVLPSLSEAFSNSLMEAMACGCCVMASAVGGNPELVRNGENGLLFPAADAPALAAALQTVIEDEALRKRLAASGTQFIQNRYSIRAAADRMGEIYTELIQRRTGTAREA